MQRIILSLITIVIIGASATAEAAEAEGAAPAAAAMTGERPMPALDIGATTGWNNPGGIYGVELEYRLLDHLSAGVAAGSGSWGIRLTPQVRAYPFTADLGLFAELGCSLNFGTTAEATENGQSQTLEMDLVPAINASLGWRIDFANKWAWIVLRAGYAYSLADEQPYSVKGGGDVFGFTKTVMDALTPGGPIIGFGIGAAIL